MNEIEEKCQNAYHDAREFMDAYERVIQYRMDNSYPDAEHLQRLRRYLKVCGILLITSINEVIG